MFSAKILFRTCLAAAALSACAGESAVNAGAQNSPPPVIWQGVQRLNLLCLVAGPNGVDQQMGSELCRRVQALAAEGAPYPVEAIGLGDPAILGSNAVTLVAQASYRPQGDARLFALSIRPFRNGAEPGPVFAAAPRAVLLPASGSLGGLDEAIRAALSETLPWQARSGAVRQIPQ